MSAAAVEAALESMTTIRDVQVSGVGTAQLPWYVSFLDADLDRNDMPYVLEREIKVQPPLPPTH